MKYATLMLAALALLVGGVGKARAGPIYNTAQDFSATTNPNGVWSYGQFAAGNTPDYLTFTPFTNENSFDNLDHWANSFRGAPEVVYNPNPYTVYPSSAEHFPPQETGAHPGPNGEYAVFRFTAPQSGNYDLSALFWNNNDITTTDVHVLKNGASLFDGSVNGPSTASFNSLVSLAAGDFLDFAVGFGSNGNYGNDATGVDGSLQLISPTPEPASLTLFGIGIAAMAGYGWRRRKLTAK